MSVVKRRRFPLRRLLRGDGRRRRFVARYDRHGVGGLRRLVRLTRDFRRFRREVRNQRRSDLRRQHRNGAGPSNQHAQPPAPPRPDVPAWLLAGPAAEDIDPAMAAPPPPFWCSVHGWVVCPLHEYDFATHDAPQPPPTPAVVEAEAGAPLARSPTAPHVPDAPPAPRLPSPTPATPPPSPRASARRRVLALGVPLASSPSTGRFGRSGIWSPAALGLANGVAPGSHLPGGSSSEDEHGAARRW